MISNYHHLLQLVNKRSEAQVATPERPGLFQSMATSFEVKAERLKFKAE